MATRSRIGMVKSDGKIVSVYCHWDGYPSHVGKLLLENYNTPEKVAELLSHGSISSLYERIGEKHDFDMEQRGPGKVCTFHHRDRGESLQIDEHKTQKELLEDLPRWEEYLYLFKDGKWRYTANTNKVNRLKPLTPAVCSRR